MKSGKDVRIVIKFLMDRLSLIKMQWPFFSGYSFVLVGRFSRGQRKQKLVYTNGSLKLSEFNMLNRRLDYFQGIVKNRYGVSGVKIILHWERDLKIVK